MTHPRAEIALLTESRFAAATAPEGDWYLANILHDDRLLQSALQDRGLSSRRIDWADPEVDWSQFRCAVFRTTWNYFDRMAEFAPWLERAGKLTRFCNDASTIRWNMDKHYLADLDAAGVPVVRSHYVERGSTMTLEELLRKTGWDETVIKPCISGGARNTYRVNKGNAESLTPLVQELLARESFILQPFEIGITQGEDSLMMFRGRCSHAVRKIPKSGDFRVQDDHGGTVHPCEPTQAQIALAERAFAACPHPAGFGRVDMILDHQGHWAVMELELIEPEMWLRKHPPAAIAFAEVIVDAIARAPEIS